ncbi:MAG: hypothetical protein HYV26_07050 [Candidatus Hydrogenedentes bacterium]|nr:hypothetical protein [Candidatus Hydrogenedentota bacterium]
MKPQFFPRVSLPLLGFPAALAGCSAFGSPLVASTMLHLLFGSALMGVCQGILLAWWMRLPERRTIYLFIGVNYLCSWVGWIGTYAFARVLPTTIYSFWSYLPLIVAFAYLLTLALAWPFVAVALSEIHGRKLKSFSATVLLQTVSFAVIVAWYWSGSDFSLLEDTHQVPISAIGATSPARVFYIAPGGHEVLTQSMSGAPELVYRAPGVIASLEVRRNRERPGRWDLVAILATGRIDNPEVDVVRPAFLSPLEQPIYVNGQSVEDLTTLYRGDSVVAGLGVPDYEGWRFDSGAYFVSGWKEEDPGSRFLWSMNSPAALWGLSRLTYLPGGFLIICLQDEQICLLDLATRNLALVAHGRSPVVVLESAQSLSGGITSNS